MTDTLIETVAYLVANDDVTRADLAEALATQTVGRMKAEAEIERLREERSLLRESLEVFKESLGTVAIERDRAFDARNLALKEMSAAARQAGSWQGIAEGKDVVIRQLEAERDRLRAALRIIAGYQQCIDNLMSNVDVARTALGEPAHD